MWPSDFPLTNDDACDNARDVTVRVGVDVDANPDLLSIYSSNDLVAELKRRRDEAANIARLVKEAELDYDGA